MSDTLPLNKEEMHRYVAVQYLNASGRIFEGLKQQHKRNPFHFVISLRSFLEYTRRGIWYLCWANHEKLKESQAPTFDSPGSPNLKKMDIMLNEALGKGSVTAFDQLVPGVNEPFIDLLHALTHGNPISVRAIAFGLDKIFDIDKLLLRSQVDLGLFRILVYRRMIGEKQRDIFKMLSTIHNRPGDVQANELIAAHVLRDSGKLDEWIKRGDSSGGPR
jgi:hypothetical protein